MALRWHDGPTLKAAIVGYGLAGSVFHAPLIAATDGPRGRDRRDVRSATGASRRSATTRAHVSSRAPDELWERAGEHDFAVIATRRTTLMRRSRARGARRRAGGGGRQAARAHGRGGARARASTPRSRGMLLTVFQNRRWDSDHLTLAPADVARGRSATSGATSRASSAGGRSGGRDAWRETTAPAAGWRRAARPRQPSRRSGAAACSGPRRTSTARSTTAAARPETTTRSWRCATGPGRTATSGCRRSRPRPGRACGCSASRRRYVVDEVDGQEDALRAGRRPERSGRVGSRAASRAGAGWSAARRASRFRASAAPGRASTRRSSARCARAARHRSIPRTRSRRSRCSRRPGAAQTSGN